MDVVCLLDTGNFASCGDIEKLDYFEAVVAVGVSGWSGMFRGYLLSSTTRPYSD